MFRSLEGIAVAVRLLLNLPGFRNMVAFAYTAPATVLAHTGITKDRVVLAGDADTPKLGRQQNIA